MFRAIYEKGGECVSLTLNIRRPIIEDYVEEYVAGRNVRIETRSERAAS